MVHIITRRGLATLLILRKRQCEGLNVGMGERLDSPMPFLFPYTFSRTSRGRGERVGTEWKQSKNL